MGDKAGRLCVVTATIVSTFVLMVSLFSPRVWANGGTLRLSRVETGPYAVSVWTQPAIPRVGKLDTSIAVMHPQDGTPVLDVDVRLVAEPVDHSGRPITAVATPGAGGTMLLFHTNLELPRAGRWEITISMKGAAGQGSTTFEVPVRPPRRLWLPLLIAAGSVASLWLVWRRLFSGKDHGASDAAFHP